MSIRPDWIAIDWGTSRLRVWAMSGADAVLDEATSSDGMGRLEPEEFEPALLKAISGWDLPDRLPGIACGMVGARQGWVEAAYAPVPSAPTGPAPVRAPAGDPRLDIRILPGLSQAAPPDVMRGEETQIAGYLSTDPNFDGVLCLPGTHTKWVQVSAGEVVSFRTAMTGELFALLGEQSVLRHGLVGDGWDDDAFFAALGDSMSRPEALAASLFGIRAAGLLTGLDGAAARARLSGLLIGAELAAMRPYWLGQRVVLIGDTGLCALYRAALDRQGLTAETVSGDEMTLAGLIAARAQWKDRT